MEPTVTVTGHCGRGEPVFKTFKDAKAACAEVNREHPKLRHWVEACVE